MQNFFIDSVNMPQTKWASTQSEAVKIAKKAYENGCYDVGIGHIKRDKKNKLVYSMLPLQFYI